jgi:hypothetical protein
VLVWGNDNFFCLRKRFFCLIPQKLALLRSTI